MFEIVRASSLISNKINNYRRIISILFFKKYRNEGRKYVMSYFLAALYSEWLKIRKSKVIWMTIVAFTIAPLMAGFVMFVLKHPALDEKLGIIGAKAQLVGEAHWS